jgi:phosphohistidine swiveling domain-containing protein
MPAPAKRTPAVIGGKAQQLLELQLAGFRVPDFLCAPPNLAAAIEVLGLPLAVRSSACVEDGREQSFAGQFRSFLNLRTVEEVEAAVHACQASVHAPPVAEYCRKNGLDPRALRMSVIVQRMVQPELAGVVFTVNPATGAEEIVIEACEGLADDLLAGKCAALPATHPLLLRHRGHIERVAREIQRHFGAPQDIEFAIENGELFILQSRPITRIQFAPGIGEWTNADFRDGGVSAGVCTPLMWSLYDFIWEATLKGFLREIHLLRGDFPAGRLFFGRPYWNLGAVKQCLASLPGFVEREFDRDLSVEANYEGDGIRTPITVKGVLRALPTVLAVPRIWRRQDAFDRAFLNGGFETLLREYDLQSSDLEAGFRRLIHEAYWITESNYFRTIFCASLAKLTFLESFPDADYVALVSALPPMRHLEPTHALREMAARGETDVTLLQKRFPHRSRRELDLRAPRWDEDPEWVAGLLQQHAAAAGSDPHPAYERARAEALAKLPWRRRRTFVRKLDRLRHFLWLREEMRDLSSRMYHRIRRHVLALAAQRGLGDDIFFLTFQEVLADDRSRIDERRERYESFRNFKAPNEIGARFDFAPRATGGELRGIAASGGQARGVARVARTIEEAMQVERGAILICPFTDPGWTPVLDRVAAVVTETGGLLSHAAVICREYGIPAVLSVPDATIRIADGARVVVHGSEGFVQLVNPTHSVPVDRRGEDGRSSSTSDGSPKIETP